MTPEQTSCFEYTLAHFKEIARQNRFPENASIEHDTDRCAVCHPELLPLDPFAVYLEIVTQAIKIRRPRLDQDVVDAINDDRVLIGLEPDVSLELLLKGDDEAVAKWRQWVRDALSTALELLSVHSPTSQEFGLEDGEEAGMGDLIEQKVREIMEHQKK